MPSLASLLRASPWARALSPADLARVEAETITRICAPGSLVCRKGEAVEAWIGVVDGLVKMANVSPDGKPTSFVLHFLEGRDELTPESKAELDKVLAELKRRPLPDIVVIGHTDTVGTLAYNDKLSLARAERVRDMMVALGIPASRIQVAGRGKRELVVQTDENVSEARNRRVEINVR